MKKLTLLVIIIVAIGATGWWLIHKHRLPTAKNVTHTSSYNKKQYSLSDPSSLWIIVNKARPLQPRDYTPADLVTPKVPLEYSANDPRMKMRAAAASAVESLVTGAKKQGLNLMIASGYRSYTAQTTTYNSEVKAYGAATADRESARPGYSEHQTGWAVDLAPVSKKCLVQNCFADTAEGKWLAQHAYEYGFVLRYQKSNQTVTGYIYEPWHIRYVGLSLATELHKHGNPPLETFFGLDPAPEYR